MTVQKILDQLEDSDNPVAKALHVGESFKVLVFGFKKGMKLADNITHHPAKLLVMKGDIIYKRSNRDTRMKEFDEVEIPPEIPHTISALGDSLLLFTQGSEISHKK
jgi:quercetin dioxygenase-like cupin family protein